MEILLANSRVLTIKTHGISKANNSVVPGKRLNPIQFFFFFSVTKNEFFVNYTLPQNLLHFSDIHEYFATGIF